MAFEFSPKEQAVLGIVQGDLPDSLTPYADIARQCAVSEADVLELLRRLKAKRCIRRFGASIKHQKSGWAHNMMVAWVASEAEAESCGPLATQNPRISHVYYRPSTVPDWPYTLYTMIHGRSETECQNVLGELLDAWPLRNYVALCSLKELKKISMRYFA